VSTQAIDPNDLLLAIIELLADVRANLNEDFPIQSVVYGQRLVAVTNQSVPLAQQPCSQAVIAALPGNAANVYLGDSGVGSSSGYVLQAGQSVGVIVDNMYQLSVNGTAGDGVCWIGT
jgi:hypothetical protein